MIFISFDSSYISYHSVAVLRVYEKQWPRISSSTRNEAFSKDSRKQRGGACLALQYSRFNKGYAGNKISRTELSAGEELNVANQLKTKVGQERREEKALVLREASEEAKEQKAPTLWTKGQTTSELDKIKNKHKK